MQRSDAHDGPQEVRDLSQRLRQFRPVGVGLHLRAVRLSDVPRSNRPTPNRPGRCNHGCGNRWRLRSRGGRLGMGHNAPLRTGPAERPPGVHAPRTVRPARVTSRTRCRLRASPGTKPESCGSLQHLQSLLSLPCMQCRHAQWNVNPVNVLLRKAEEARPDAHLSPGRVRAHRRAPADRPRSDSAAHSFTPAAAAMPHPAGGENFRHGYDGDITAARASVLRIDVSTKGTTMRTRTIRPQRRIGAALAPRRLVAARGRAGQGSAARGPAARAVAARGRIALDHAVPVAGAQHRRLQEARRGAHRRAQQAKARRFAAADPQVGGGARHHRRRARATSPVSRSGARTATRTSSRSRCRA